MLFKQEHVEPIISGDKTQTRRPVKANKKTGKVNCAYKAGNVYQARLNYKDKPFAYLRVTGVKKERLADMSDRDCVLEGYASRSEYREVYQRIYKKFDENEYQWVIDFEVISDIEYYEERLNGKLRNK